MKLVAALSLGPSELVAFVGGGGKTSAMFRLADEIVAAGGRVVTTTTTRIFAAQVALAPKHLIAGQATGDNIDRALAETGHVLVTGPVDDDAGKTHGVDPHFVESLLDLPSRPTVLIEADGSRMRPLKAPAAHEPVIPARTTLLVPVVGADVLGEPLDAERVHRPERVAALGEWAVGDPVTPELVARVLTHPDGGLKMVPPRARVIPLINKVESDDRLAAARATADRLLENDRIEAVLIGAVRTSEPVREAWGRVGAIVLAAGRSTRMGRLKQNLPWGKGQTLVGAVVSAMQASPVAGVVVVTGMAHETVEASLAQNQQAGARPVTLVHNPDFAETEMARSLQAGLAGVPGSWQAVIVALADQPEVDPDVTAQVIQRWRATRAPVVAPYYQGRRGHPLLFDRSLWPALLTLPGSANPRDVVAAAGRVERVEVDSAAILRDIDTPDDYERAIGSG